MAEKKGKRRREEMIFIFIICGLIALLELAIVGRNQEDIIEKNKMLELEIKMKNEQIENLNTHYKKLEEEIENLAKTNKTK